MNDTMLLLSFDFHDDRTVQAVSYSQIPKAQTMYISKFIMLHTQDSLTYWFYIIINPRILYWAAGVCQITDILLWTLQLWQVNDVIVPFLCHLVSPTIISR